MLFDGFFGIDWSGDKSQFQKGIKVAYLDKKNINPKIIAPRNKNKYWNRSSLIEYLKNLNPSKSYLIGFDFAFAYPFEDYKNYFSDFDNPPKSAKKLWDFIDFHCDFSDFRDKFIDSYCIFMDFLDEFHDSEQIFIDFRVQKFLLGIKKHFFNAGTQHGNLLQNFFFDRPLCKSS